MLVQWIVGVRVLCDELARSMSERSERWASESMSDVCVIRCKAATCGERSEYSMQWPKDHWASQLVVCFICDEHHQRVTKERQANEVSEVNNFNAASHKRAKRVVVCIERSEMSYQCLHCALNVLNEWTQWAFKGGIFIWFWTQGVFFLVPYSTENINIIFLLFIFVLTCGSNHWWLENIFKDTSPRK